MSACDLGQSEKTQRELSGNLTSRERKGTGLALRIITMSSFPFVSFVYFICYDSVSARLVDAMSLLISDLDRKR